MVIYDEVFSKGKPAITKTAASPQCFQPALPPSGAVMGLQLHPESDPGTLQFLVTFPHFTTATKP